MKEKRIQETADHQCPDEEPSRWGIVLSVSFALLGVGWFVYDRQQKIAEGHEAASWPHTTGTILRVVRVERYWRQGKYGCFTTKTREIKVRYAYQVDGCCYEGTRIHPVYGPSGSEEPHHSLQELLQRGQRVLVYYQRENPGKSTLTVGDYSKKITEQITPIE